MFYAVYDGNKLARYPECKVHPSWDNCIFNSFDEAVNYVHRWLFPDWADNSNSSTGIAFKVNTPYEYNEGCFIEIREID